jgi:hypothetical protein
MAWVGLEPTIPVFERAKTVHALHRATTVIGLQLQKDLEICDSGTLVQILCFWTLSIILFLSENTVVFIFQNTTFRKLDSVSIFR